MTLPASGNSISISQINTELTPRAYNTADTSLQACALGSNGTINLNSPTFPNSVEPHSMSEWYSYNHAAAAPPSFNSVSQSNVSTPDCGVEWVITVSWNTSNSDNTNYKVRIKAYGTNDVLADSLTTASSSWTHYTTKTGDAALSTYSSTYRYTVEMVRLSDGGGAGSASTTGETRTYGDAC